MRHFAKIYASNWKNKDRGRFVPFYTPRHAPWREMQSIHLHIENMPVPINHLLIEQDKTDVI